MSDEQLVTEAYRAFNARDIDAALALMHSNVEWPNGMDGGFVYGRDAVRRYWQNQWQMIDPRVEPRGMTRDADGRMRVDVHQIVRDLAGNLLTDRRVEHIYRIDDGLVTRMEIHEP